MMVDKRNCLHLSSFAGVFLVQKLEIMLNDSLINDSSDVS